MKPAPFEYHDPTTVDQAVALLREHEADVKLLAGGQSLVPLLNMRLARPAVIVDLNRVAGLDYIRRENGHLAIGALTRQRAVERSEVVAGAQPLLHAATKLIAHPQIRNRGTIGGSIAHADPAAEYPAVALALDAELVAVGPNGQRAIKAADFFVTYLTTALDPAEVLTEVRVPVLPERTGWSFQEVSRRHGDFALAGAAVTLTLGARGECETSRVALFGVAPTPVRARAVEEALLGQTPDDVLFEAAAERAGDGLDDALTDVHATAEFRRHLARVLTRRALVEAASRAQGAA
jgi:CO/xanthine dehydrogenase FAD-binding subunit